MLVLFHRPNKPREIDAARLEDLFARGLNNLQVAKELGLEASFLSRKINQRLSLQMARQKGRERAKTVKRG